MAMKVVLISTSVLSAAIMLSLSTTDIVDSVPWIYKGVVSCLRPPYLYLLINCIIIAIVAASKLQTESEDIDSPPPSDTAVEQQPLQIIQTDFEIPAKDYIYGGVERMLDFDELDSSRKEDSTPSVITSCDAAVDSTRNKENECLAVKSMWIAAEDNGVRNYVKPPASARFSHRRNLKSSPEGGRTVLGVSRPKKQDTLENTWKTITEGRPIPISRHLKKSDPFQHDRRHQQENTPPPKTMKKAETFKDGTNPRSQSPGRGGSGKTRKEASLSQDDLNKRVEAFIKKFNEEMRLQRQVSLTQYKEMIKH